ncbi:uncharacterized protein TNCV_4101361 [Trichonephila clavipes]|nr:uncharacterized protein TNCV_4101361 [Trichonephila clavipes]
MHRHRIRAHYKQLSEFERDHIIGSKEAGWAIGIAHHMGRGDAGWNHADWGRIVFSDESHFQLCPDNHRRRVWRHLGQRADPVFPIAFHTSPQPGVILRSAISFDSRIPLGVIRGTLTSQQYVDDILRTVLLPFLLQYPGLFFSKIMPDHIQHMLL